MVDYRIELVGMPVSDVDRALEFYGTTLGWPVDHDHTVSDDVRFIQVTPPGSACSIAFGNGVSDMPPGSMRALQVVVALRRRGAGRPARRAGRGERRRRPALGPVRVLRRPRRQHLERPGAPGLLAARRLAGRPASDGRPA